MNRASSPPGHDLPRAAASRAVSALAEAIDPAERARALTRLADAFLDRGPRMASAEVAVFGSLFERLFDDVDPAQRVAVSEQLADLPHAPRQAVFRLAMDPIIRVARPVLSRSAVMTETDLLAVADVHGTDHLIAMAGRAALGTRIADRLARSSSMEVISALLRNADARLSNGAMLALLDTASRHSPSLGRLGDVRDSLDGLIAIARARSAQAYPPEPAHAAAAPPALRQAEQTEAAVQAALIANSARAVAEALADGRTVPVALAELTIRRRDPDLILVLARLNELTFPVTRDLVGFVLGAPLGDGAARRLEADYARITPQAARRAVRFLSLHASRAR